MTGTLNANSAGTGLAGTIKLIQTGYNSMTLSGATITASGNANGSGSGNEIDITSPADIQMAGTVVHADGTGTGNAFGGSVNITSAAQIDLTQPNILISATGAENGAGGNAVISSTVQFAVDSVIKVNAGSAAPTSIFDGIIQLNGAACRQWRTTYAWPTDYWVCTGNNPPSATDSIPVSVASGIPSAATRALLSNNAHVYVFTSSATESAFFTDTNFPNSSGFTYRTPNQLGLAIETSAFEQCTNCLGHSGSYSLTSQEFKEDSAHELGHAVDYSMGTTLESEGATYINYFYNDSILLDYTVVGSTQASSTQRPACSTNSTGAFDNIQARPQPTQAPVPMCINGALNPALGTIPPGTLNSQILTGGHFSHTTTALELYAQTFAYLDAANPSDYLDITGDQLFAGTPFYSCSLARAQQLVNNTGTIGASCNNAVPQWYENLVGH